VGFLKEAFQVPYFFTIYINDLPDVVQNIANLFLDDTKVYAIVNKEEEQHSLQNEKTTECIGQISGS
jgi:hypothetical protein